MADIKKFLDQNGIGILWSRIIEEISKETVRAEAAEKEASDAAKTAQNDIDALEENIGNVDNLSTTNKTIVGAINEALAAIGTGGTAAAVTITSDTTTEGALKSYTIKQGSTTVGVIDIPKDMVVESGSVVTNPEGQAEGTYIELILANVSNPLYINVGHLVDIYKVKEEASQIQLSIDTNSREISANIVANSITSTELADNSIITSKIADANVTKAKLSSAVQTSLDKADNSATQSALNSEIQRATESEGDLNDRLTVVENKFGTGEDSVSSLISKAKQEAIDAAATDATSKANSAESNAKSYTDTEVAKIQALSEAEIDAAIAAATNKTN